MNRFLLLLSFCFFLFAYGLNAQNKTRQSIDTQFSPINEGNIVNEKGLITLSTQSEPVMSSIFSCSDNSLFGNTISSYNGAYVSDISTENAAMTSFTIDGTMDTITIWGMNLYHDGSSFVGGGGPVVENPNFNVRFYYPNPSSPEGYSLEFKDLTSIATNTEKLFSSYYENSYIYQYKIPLPTSVDITEGCVSVLRASEQDTCQFLWINSKVGSGTSYNMDFTDNSMSANSYPLSVCMQGTVTNHSRPQNLAVSSITQHSAILSWDEMGTSTEWQIGISNENGQIEDLGTTSTTSKVIKDLTEGESYTVFVRSLYGTESSLWSPMTFTTVEPTVDTLYESFEDAAVPPKNWTVFHTGAGTKDWYAASVPFTGKYCAVAMFENSGGINHQWLVTGRITVPEAKDLVFFTRDNYTEDYGSTLSVKISTDSIRTDADAYTDLLVLSESDISNSNYLPFKVDLSAYVGKEVYLAFVMSDNYGDAWAIDEIGLFESYSPYNLEVLDNSATTATIGWTGIDSEYNVQYGPTGFTLGEGITQTVSDADSVILTGLTPATYYDVYVQSVNSYGKSTWSDSLTFFTTSAYTTVTSYPLVEDFSGDWNTMDWRIIDVDEDGYTWFQGASFYDPLSGDYMAQIYHSDDDYLISPPLVVENALQVSWYDRISNATTPFFPQIMKLGISTTGVETSDFTSVKERVESYKNEWVKHTVYLGDYVGETIYLAFHATLQSGDIYSIDSLVVEEVPNCPQPYALDASDIKSNAAVLSWVGNASNYTIEYGAEGFNLGEGISVTTTNTTLAIQDLYQDTRYEYYVKAATANGAESEYAGPYLFITMPETTTIRDFPYYQDFEDMDSLEYWTPMLNYPDKGEGLEGDGLKRSFGAYQTWRIKDYNENTYAQRLVYEGSQSIFIDGGSMFNDWLVSPDIEVPSQGGSFDFMYFSVMRANDTLRYYVNLYDGDKWNTVLSYQDMKDTVSYDTPVSIDLTPYASKTIKVAFVHSTNDGYQFAVDSLVINGIKNTEDELLSFEFDGVKASYETDAENHTIHATITSDTDISKLIASFSLSAGANAYISSVEQESGVTVNDFSAPITFSVVSEDEETQTDWTITVTGTSTGIENSNKVGDINLFPNPTTSQITVQGVLENSTINIYNMNGQCLKTLNAESTTLTIDLSSFDRGIYFLEVTNSLGKSIHKVMKK